MPLFAQSETSGGEVGELLRSYREHRGLSQQHLADLSTVSVRTIRNMESGAIRRTRRQTLRLLAAALKLDKVTEAMLTEAVARSANAQSQGDTKGLDLRPPYAHNALVGRRQEADALTQALLDGDNRLAVISGMSGMGKSRLAMEIARRLRAHGSWPVLWVPGATDRTGRTPLLFHAAGVAAAAVRGEAEAVVRLVRLVGENEAVIVLDAIGDADAASGPIFSLLGACPRLRILVTVIAPWQAPGALLHRLKPLEVPEPAIWDVPHRLMEAESVRLFAERTRNLLPDIERSPSTLTFAAQLCSELDGIPLALEVAAHRCAMLSPDLLPGDWASAGSTDGQGLFTNLEPVWSAVADTCAVLSSVHCGQVGELAVRRARWSVEEASGELGIQACAAVELLHALTDLGLMRIERAGGSVHYVLLNLVRRFLLGRTRLSEDPLTAAVR